MNCPSIRSQTSMGRANQTVIRDKELLRLCRAGRLYEEEVDRCGQAAGHACREAQNPPSSCSRDRVSQPSELIARHKVQASKNAAPSKDAMSIRRLDFVKLLVENGAQITSVPFADVLLNGNSNLIRFFFHYGPIQV